jgi:hypothetical protein
MLVYLVVIWAVSGGLWLWLLIWDVKIRKANEQLRDRLRQLQRTSQQDQSESSCTHHIGQKPPPFPSEQPPALEK